MKNQFLLCFMIFFVKDLYSFEIDKELVGWWKSDHKLTYDFNSAVVKKEYFADVEKMWGNLYILYKKNGTVEIFLKGKNEITKVDETNYSVVLISRVSLILIFGQPDSITENYRRIRFVDNKTYWIYLSSGGMDFHLREYFIKISEPEFYKEYIKTNGTTSEIKKNTR